MRNEALYSRVPLGHENVQPLQVPVARVDACEIRKALQACQVMDASHLCPEFPAKQTCASERFWCLLRLLHGRMLVLLLRHAHSLC